MAGEILRQTVACDKAAEESGGGAENDPPEAAARGGGHKNACKNAEGRAESWTFHRRAGGQCDGKKNGDDAKNGEAGEDQPFGSVNKKKGCGISGPLNDMIPSGHLCTPLRKQR